MESSRDLSLYRPSEVRLISVLVEYRSYLRDFLHEHFYFLIAIAIYIYSIWLIAWHYGVVNRIRINVYSEKFALICLIYIFLFFVGHAVYVMIFIRPDRLTKYILADLKENYLTPKRLLNAIPVIVIFQLFASAYTSLKALIPVINPYSWDDLFVKFDAFIHFGLQPWQLLHPFLGNPLITYIINFMYNLWFFIVLLVLFQQIFSLKDQKLRMQFLLAVVGVWSILGGVLATCFSSVGPCFYGNLTGDHETFRPLMQYLTFANTKYHIFSLETQKYLWENYTANKMVFGSGISAMPSMHVSKIFLIALLGWRKNAVLGAVFTIYTFFIMLGSVHLAWHYAVDGYLSIIVTLVIWVISGRIAGRIKFTEKT